MIDKDPFPAEKRSLDTWWRADRKLELEIHYCPVRLTNFPQTKGMDVLSYSEALLSSFPLLMVAGTYMQGAYSTEVKTCEYYHTDVNISNDEFYWNISLNHKKSLF